MKRVKIAIQGINGSYSEEAANDLVRGRADIVECTSFEGVFRALRSGRAERAVLPVHNRINGPIRPVMQLLAASRMPVVERVRLPIRHVLAGTADADISKITSIRSHPEALKQCSGFLETVIEPGIEQPAADTATSIREVIQLGDPTAAAICSPRAAELYGAKVLSENIADEGDNWTEFVMLA